jgi:ferredoxin--NADP+ reductase
LKADAELQIAGPIGETCLAPKDPKANVIMIATGTGIALFRSFLNKFFDEPTQKFEGQAQLFLGVQSKSHLLYE